MFQIISAEGLTAGSKRLRASGVRGDAKISRRTVSQLADECDPLSDDLVNTPSPDKI